MEELKRKLSLFLSDRLYQIIISNPRKKEGVFKIKIRPVIVKEELYFQETIWKGTQVFHENYEKEEVLAEILLRMENEFKQLEAESMDGRLNVLISKKGKVTIKCQENKAETQAKKPDMSHNRTKRYLLKEGNPVPFLVDLGVQTKDGQIIRARYDKFKQINRYLEFVEDILPKLNTREVIRIIDFGCGKSYLTFALYYYLHQIKKLNVQITGLDLKEDVIHKCNLLAESYKYHDLHFYKGDISTFEGTDQVDMVVTLHACDTATDYAIEKAVKWNAKVIFAVPCCQHEVNKQIENEMLSPIFKYGLIKERISALITDGVRAGLLEEWGYDTQILEFIDMEHTPKNILIRAVKRDKIAEEHEQRFGESLCEKENETQIALMCKALHVETTLQKLIKEQVKLNEKNDY